MRKLVVLFLLIPMALINAQKIGKIAPDPEPTKFPPNAWGVNLMFSEGGFGLGTFFKKNYTTNLSGIIDFSISEIKDDREIEVIDYYYGLSYTRNKKNRALLLPLNIGVQYRLFSKVLTDNLRPYVTFAIGPHVIVSSPYIKDKEKLEFFSSLKYAKANYALGGYIGMGATFGISKKNLAGLSIRYYYSHLFNEGIENVEGKFRKNISGLFISINIGMMY